MIKRKEIVLKKFKTKLSAGFSLIEMLVSLSIFTVVITISVGTMLVLIDANGRARNMQLVMTNFSFALDSMTRDLRTGTSWYCGVYNGTAGPSVPTDNETSTLSTSDCTNGNYVSFIEIGGSLTKGLTTKRITFWFDKDAYGTGLGAVKRKLGTAVSDGTWTLMTGSDVNISTFKIVVAGTSRYTTNADIIQPTMTLYIKGSSGFSSPGQTSKQGKAFSLETTITQRALDI